MSDYHVEVDQTSVIHHQCSQDYKQEGCKPYLGKMNTSQFSCIVTMVTDDGERHHILSQTSEE